MGQRGSARNSLTAGRAYIYVRDAGISAGVATAVAVATVHATLDGLSTDW